MYFKLGVLYIVKLVTNKDLLDLNNMLFDINKILY